MTKKQLETLNDLMKDENIKGKKSLDWFIFLNTSEPLFKEGDCFYITEPRKRIYGNDVIDIKAKIKRIYHFRGEKKHLYELVAIINNEKEVLLNKEESDLINCKKAKDNVNILEIKNKYQEELYF